MSPRRKPPVYVPDEYPELKEVDDGRYGRPEKWRQAMRQQAGAPKRTASKAPHSPSSRPKGRKVRL
jgi:hypothetical protein